MVPHLWQYSFTLSYIPLCDCVPPHPVWHVGVIKSRGKIGHINVAHVKIVWDSLDPCYTCRSITADLNDETRHYVKCILQKKMLGLLWILLCSSTPPNRFYYMKTKAANICQCKSPTTSCVPRQRVNMWTSSSLDFIHRRKKTTESEYRKKKLPHQNVEIPIEWQWRPALIWEWRRFPSLSSCLFSAHSVPVIIVLCVSFLSQALWQHNRHLLPLCWGPVTIHSVPVQTGGFTHTRTDRRALGDPVHRRRQ